VTYSSPPLHKVINEIKLLLLLMLLFLLCFVNSVLAGSTANIGNILVEKLDGMIAPTGQILTEGFVKVLHDQKRLILENTLDSDTVILLGNEMSYVFFHFTNSEREVLLLPYSGRWESEFPAEEETEEYEKAKDNVASYCRKQIEEIELHSSTRIILVDRSLSGDSPRQFKELLKSCQVSMPSSLPRIVFELFSKCRA
jgi:hypothetical protein